jgi:ABC-type uncharacterized transport system substrate-binding protein
MINNLIRLIVVALMLVSLQPAEAQQTKKVPTIGWLAAGSPSGVAPLTGAFRQGLRDLGYVVGKNIAIEYRYAEGKLDRLPTLASELVSLKLDIIVTSTTPPIQAVTRGQRERTSGYVILPPSWCTSR